MIIRQVEGYSAIRFFQLLGQAFAVKTRWEKRLAA